jgi:YggT family protein
MRQLISLLSFVINIYMMIIFIRIILTWFSWVAYGRLQEILASITDPYLNWFRRFEFLRVGLLDLSPVAAIGVLSLVNRVLSTLAFYGTISIGIILVIVLQAIWGALSFFIGFLIIVLGLRLIAHFAKLNVYNSFWRIVDTISQPVLFRINRIFLKDRIVNFGTGLIVSVAGLVVSYIVLGAFFSLLVRMLARLPL